MKKYIFAIGILFLAAFPARADTTGQQQVFSIDPQYDIKGRSQVNATLRATSQKAYFYVTDDYWNGLDFATKNNLENLMLGMGNEFDTRIYPIETAFFGSEPNPGVDGDPHITMLLASLKYNVGGYFDSAHDYKKTQVPNSNEREMLYLNTSQFGDTVRVYPFVAHEFQHLISFNQKEALRNVSDDVWLNELRSEYAISLLGYNQNYATSNLERRVSSFLEQPSDSLTEWPNDFSDYGQVALLGEYMAEHWSGRIIADTLFVSSIGINSINDALVKNGVGYTFDDVFTSWMLANLLNDASLNPLYAYTNSSLATIRVSPTQIINGPIDGIAYSYVETVKDWQQRWYDVRNIGVGIKPVLKLSFTSSANLSDFRVPYLAFYNDGTVTYRMVSLSAGMTEVRIPDLGTKVTRVIFMPFKRSKMSNFDASETSATLSITVERTESAVTTVTPEQFGLHEGDFIRAEGDKDIYIINQFGHKRIVLSPQICLQYGHLGARGCFGAVRVISPSVRDAFLTSPYYTNGETHDGKIYQLIETGEDSAYLQLVTHALDNSVFFINTREQKAYTQ